MDNKFDKLKNDISLMIPVCFGYTIDIKETKSGVEFFINVTTSRYKLVKPSNQVFFSQKEPWHFTWTEQGRMFCGWVRSIIISKATKCEEIKEDQAIEVRFSVDQMINHEALELDYNDYARNS